MLCCVSTDHHIRAYILALVQISRGYPRTGEKDHKQG